MFLYTEAILAICCSIDVELTSLPPILSLGPCSAPPKGAAEEKEYDALMAKYVGHPDVRELYDDDKSSKDSSMDSVDADLLV